LLSLSQLCGGRTFAESLPSVRAVVDTLIDPWMRAERVLSMERTFRMNKGDAAEIPKDLFRGGASLCLHAVFVVAVVLCACTLLVCLVVCVPYFAYFLCVPSVFPARQATTSSSVSAGPAPREWISTPACCCTTTATR
jgi:hypothetical protein